MGKNCYCSGLKMDNTMILSVIVTMIGSFFFYNWWKKCMSKTHVVFTDPSIMGITSTGDVDDIFAILWASMKWGPAVIFVICDDDENNGRFTHFMDQYGKELEGRYGSKFIPESNLTPECLNKAILHVHAPVSERTATMIINTNYSHLFSQGDNAKVVNFKSSGGKRLFEFISNDPRSTMFSTIETSFTIVKVDLGLERGSLAHRLHESAFEFQIRKTFGLAAHIPGLADRLYGDEDGPADGPGNGIKSFLNIIQYLSQGEELLELPPTIRKALDKTIAPNAKQGTCDNIHNIVAVLNQYTDYENLLVDGMLPNMGNLDLLTPRAKINPRVRSAIETGVSTPLFDFAAMVFSVKGKVDKSELRKMVVEMLLVYYHS